MTQPELISPFLVAAAEVLRAETGSAVQRGPLALERSAVTSQEVTALVTLVGQVEGTVLFSMSSETALGLVSRMMGEEFQRLDELVQSGIGELGNGRRSRRRKPGGAHCTIRARSSSGTGW